MRLEKRKSNDIAGMENHNERKTENHSNCDIDLEKKHLNYDLVECKSYKKKIDEEIKKRYTGKKAIRKDAVLCTEFLFTSDKDFFDKIGEEKEKIFFEKSLEFLENKFGKENIISAKVHKDEMTPHLHAVIVPLHSDGALSMKKYIDTKFDLSKLQDEYYSHISKDFSELERGKSATETKAKNIEINEFKKKTNNLDLQIDKLQKNIQSKQQYKECLETINIIEKNAKDNLFSKKISIDKKEFETVISFAKNYISEKDQIETLKKNLETERAEKNSLKNKLDRESNQKIDRNIQFNSMVRELEQTKEYVDIIEKKLIEKAPELLNESQKEFLNGKWEHEKKEFVKEKLKTNTLSSDLETDEKNPFRKRKERSRGLER